MSSKFVEEPQGDPDQLCLQDVVHDALERLGLRPAGRQPDGFVDAFAPIEQGVSEAVTAFLRDWLPEGTWTRLDPEVRERIGLGIAGGVERRPAHVHVGSEAQNQTATLACRLLGVGDVGRAFDAVLVEAGLQLPAREMAMAHRMVRALRAIGLSVGAEQQRFGWWAEPFEYLFELCENWPFVVAPTQVDLASAMFREDVHRYASFTEFAFGALHEPLLAICGQPRTGTLHGLPTQLSTWLQVLGPDIGIRWFEARLAWPSKLPASQRVASEASRLRDQLVAWQQHGGGGMSGTACVAVPVFEMLMANATDLSVEADPSFAARRFRIGYSASNRMWFAKAAYEGGGRVIAASATARWVQIVKQEMAAFRPLFLAAGNDEAPDGWQERVREWLQVSGKRPPHERAGESWLLSERRNVARELNDDSLLAAWERFDRDCEHFLACADQVFLHEGVWEGLRQLLVSFRSLRAQSVASDLRYWDEPGHPAEYPPRQPDLIWRCIPAAFVAGFHAHVGVAQREDPELKVLRGQFAAWCLQGLVDKDAKTRERAAAGYHRVDSDMVEPSPSWRYARARAVKTLAIDPGGRGHAALKVASEIDPDPRVREVANDAYQSLRRGLGMPSDSSPRRAVLGAFWWLRQAHLLDLDPMQKIDAEGAQRTRRKELDRTKEPTV
ncbi:MAG: hypothetical protein JNK15_11070 [Planctomycetes bacterium]|nr:hypothetical protein [Planctomycetota bacterium]